MISESNVHTSIGSIGICHLCERARNELGDKKGVLMSLVFEAARLVDIVEIDSYEHMDNSSLAKPASLLLLAI
jgi:hypothetical protein